MSNHQTDLIPYLMDIKALAASTEARVASLEKHITARLDNQDQRVNTHGERIRSLEKSSWRRGGAIAVLAAFLTYMIPGLKGLFT